MNETDFLQGETNTREKQKKKEKLIFYSLKVLLPKLEYLAEHSGNGSIIHDANVAICIISGNAMMLEKNKNADEREFSRTRLYQHRAEKFLKEQATRWDSISVKDFKEEK